MINLTEWACWSPSVDGINLRHAARILLAAGELETLVLTGDRNAPPLDRALQRYQRERRKMGRNDRLVLGAAVYHLARNRTLFAGLTGGLSVGEGQVLLLSLADAVGPQGDLGAVRHLPGGVRPWRQRLAVLRRERSRLTEEIQQVLAENLAGLSAAARDALTDLFSVPSWWLDAGPWRRVDEAVRELSRLRQPQALTLRVQTHRERTREEVIATLEALGIPSVPTTFSPWGIVVRGRHNVLATELVRSGAVEVQDEGSQLVACLCDPKPGETVLDLCAGAGGKSLALASAMGGRGTVIAYDISPNKLATTRKRARRAGLGNVRVVERPEQVAQLGPYDLVLADVPCTSSGTLRRNPDAAWRWRPEQLGELRRTQIEILNQAATLVRPGGYLVYSTCSILDAENSNQIREFCSQSKSMFEVAPPGDRTLHRHLPHVPESQQGWFRLAANLTDYTGDGFFAARLRRKP